MYRDHKFTTNSPFLAHRFQVMSSGALSTSRSHPGEQDPYGCSTVPQPFPRCGLGGGEAKQIKQTLVNPVKTAADAERQ